MADLPVAHGTPNPSPHVHGVKGFMATETAGMPNWVWLIVIGGGIAIAYFLPKILGSKTGSGTPTTGADTSGLGLAVDPTTGLPYAVEGLVPSGGISQPGPTPNPPPISGQCPTGFTFSSGALGGAIPPGAYPVSGGYCVPNTPAPGGGFTWPTALSGMKVWQGTQTGLLWYGPYGPITGRLAQQELSSLFPQGTTFRVAGNQFYYTIPGGTEQLAPVSLVSGNPQPPKQGENLKWPGQ